MGCFMESYVIRPRPDFDSDMYEQNEVVELKGPKNLSSRRFRESYFAEVDVSACKLGLGEFRKGFVQMSFWPSCLLYMSG